MSFQWSLTLSQLLGSKAVVDRLRVPQNYYDLVNNGISELESWTKTFKGFEVDKPQTWVSTGLSVVRRISEPEKEIVAPKKNLIQRFVQKLKLVKLDHLNSILFYQDVIQDNYHLSELVIPGEKGDLRRIALDDCPEDFFFFELTDPSEIRERRVVFTPFLPNFSKYRERRDRINQSISSMYWKNRRIIKFDIRDSEVFDYATFDPPTRQYEGILSRLYDDLKVYRDKGIRRSILFQGPPGTGKSTLAFNISERLSNRTLILTHTALSWMNDETWNYLISMIQPEMIIVDDIDRVSKELERKLYLFEDSYCPVPLIIMTSNHSDWLPDAFRRPGRIDQIVEMQTPAKEIRYEVVRKIAKLEGVEVPEERMEVLERIHQEYPGAYIVELLRRVRAQGWDYKIPEYDLTFSELNVKVKSAWNREEIAPSAESFDLEDFE